MFGDTLGRLGVTFPITTGRYHSMIEDYPVPIRRTLDQLGPGPYSLGEGVAATLTHLRTIGLLKA
jgi:hypothetical protein